MRDALGRLAAEQELVGALFVGGEEKLEPGMLSDPLAHYGIDVTVPDGDTEWDTFAALRTLAASTAAQTVVDISGEPVLGGRERMALACVALDLGLEYRNADTSIVAPSQHRLNTDVPVVSVIGTGKRTGKTAVCGHFARLLREQGKTPVIVSMGRGGPPEPHLVAADKPLDAAALLELSRAGRHAASDYLEDAALAGVTTVGCRRAGEGFAGQVFDSNVQAGAELALTLDPDVLLVEGSGAAFPPVAADRTVCITSAASVCELAYLGPLRLLRADSIVVVGPSPKDFLQELERWVEGKQTIICELRPEPAAEITPSERVAVFTTAPPDSADDIGSRLRASGVDGRLLSTNLARRSELEQDLERAQQEDCAVYLTELKAAAIDTVAEHAERHGARLVFLRNTPVSLAGQPDLDEQLLGLVGVANSSAAASR